MHARVSTYNAIAVSFEKVVNTRSAKAFIQDRSHDASRLDAVMRQYGGVVVVINCLDLRSQNRATLRIYLPVTTIVAKT